MLPSVWEFPFTSFQTGKQILHISLTGTWLNNLIFCKEIQRSFAADRWSWKFGVRQMSTCPWQKRTLQTNQRRAQTRKQKLAQSSGVETWSICQSKPRFLEFLYAKGSDTIIDVILYSGKSKKKGERKRQKESLVWYIYEKEGKPTKSLVFMCGNPHRSLTMFPIDTMVCS